MTTDLDLDVFAALVEGTRGQPETVGLGSRHRDGIYEVSASAAPWYTRKPYAPVLVWEITGGDERPIFLNLALGFDAEGAVRRVWDLPLTSVSPGEVFAVDLPL